MGKPSAEPRGGTWIHGGLLLVIAVTLLLEFLSLGPLRDSFWGFHLKAFLPWPLRIALWIPALVALLLLARRLPVSTPNVAVAPAVQLALLLVASTLLFWVFRTRNLFLGDGLPIAINLPRGDYYHPRAPLAHVLLTGWYALFGGDTQAGDPDAVREVAAWHSILWGVLWVGVAWFLGRELTWRPKAASAPALLATLLLLTQGYMLLFFGYVEYYAVTAFLAGAYLWSGLLYLRRRAPLALPALLLVLLVGCHFSTAVLLASFLVLAGIGLRDPSRRRRALRDLAVLALGLVLLDRELAQLRDGFGLLGGLWGTLGTSQTDRGGGSGLDYLLSLRHVRDFINDHHLIGPLGLGFFLLAGIAWLSGRTRLSARTGFVLAAALPVLAVSVATAEPILGYPRDWDIFASLAITFPVAALVLLFEGVKDAGRLRSLLAAAVLFSAGHTAGWIALNTSEPRSMERFAALPLGLGRGAVVIGNWHLRHGNQDEARRWFERSLIEGPRNPNAYELLGVLHMQQGRIEEAAAAFVRAATLRPDKIEYRREALEALLQLGRCADALPHFEVVIRSRAVVFRDHLYYGNCLDQLGRAGEASAAFLRAETFFEEQRAALERDPDAWIGLGHLRRRLGKPDEARAAFQNALRLLPQSDPRSGEVRRWLAEN